MSKREANRDGAINCVAELRRTAIVGGKFGIIHWKVGMGGWIGRKEGRKRGRGARTKGRKEGRKEAWIRPDTSGVGTLIRSTLAVPSSSLFYPSPLAFGPLLPFAIPPSCSPLLIGSFQTIRAPPPRRIRDDSAARRGFNLIRC